MLKEFPRALAVVIGVATACPTGAAGAQDAIPASPREVAGCSSRTDPDCPVLKQMDAAVAKSTREVREFFADVFGCQNHSRDDPGCPPGLSPSGKLVRR